MKKKGLIIFSLLILVLLGVYFFFGNKNTNTGGLGTTEEKKGFFDVFFDFGNKNNNQQGTDPIDGTPSDDQEPGQDQVNSEYKRLRNISEKPVAGFSFNSKERLVVKEEQVDTVLETVDDKPEFEMASNIRYILRDTGYIYDVFTDDTSITTTRVTNTTIPKIQEAYFWGGGAGVITRYLDKDNQTIKTYVGSITENIGEEPGSVTGYFLEDNIEEITLSPDRSSLAYIKKYNLDTFFYTVTLPQGTKTSFFDSSFNSWLPVWSGDKTISLSTKGSYHALGYIYSLSTDGILKKISGGKNGMVGLLDPENKYLLYSNTSGSQFELSILDINKNTSTNTGIRTLVDKCTWNSSGLLIYCAVPSSIIGGVYPDEWYQGLKSFSDGIWVINPTSLTSYQLLDTSKEDVGDMDIIRLSIDDTDQHLGFMDKNTGSLWVLDI